MVRLIGLFLAVYLLSATPLAASTRPADRGAGQEAAVGACIARAAEGRPWLAKTLWGLRDQEGGWVGAAIRNTNDTEDLGPLQVNSWWIPRIAVLVKREPAAVRRWLQYDPCFNVDAARWIFLSALAVTKDYWTAVGVYHSPTDWRQRRYAWSVAARLKARFGPAIFSAHDGSDRK